MSTRVRVYRLLLLAAAMALATVAIGWWGVLFVAVVFAVVDRRWSVPAEAGVAATVAWLALFLVNAVLRGPTIIALAGGAMALPAFALPLVTIVFPGLLAWSGASVTVALAQIFGRARQVEPVRVAPQ